MKLTFYDWCVNNNRYDLLDRWDYELNSCSPKEIGRSSAKSIFFKCPKNRHESEAHTLSAITSTNNMEVRCKKCGSIAQVTIDKFGEDYFWSRWHKNNIINPFDISANVKGLKIIIQCVSKDYHVYEQSPSSFCKGIGCPYCNGKIVHEKDSLAIQIPEVLNLWSEKNDKTPYEYTSHSNKKAWFKCPCGKHKDSYKSINNAVTNRFSCWECRNENISKLKLGENNIFWRGGVCGENDRLRHSAKYKQWRTSVYKRDNYTCQCCGKHGVLNAHHLVSFSDYAELRYDINNGLTLCEQCHDSTKEGSFHNIYGTHNNTIDQLREYILNKSNIDIYVTHPEILSLNNSKQLPPEKEELINEEYAQIS